MDESLLEAALVGYQQELRRLDQVMSDLKRKIGETQKSIPKVSRLSVAARKRIAAAQRKRWAEYKAKLAGK